MKIIVTHRSYGCDTGCCGHVVEWTDEAGDDHEVFDFSHPYGDDAKAFAESLVEQECGAEHVKDLDWDNCIVSND